MCIYLWPHREVSIPKQAPTGIGAAEREPLPKAVTLWVSGSSMDWNYIKPWNFPISGNRHHFLLVVKHSVVALHAAGIAEGNAYIFTCETNDCFLWVEVYASNMPLCISLKQYLIFQLWFNASLSVLAALSLKGDPAPGFPALHLTSTVHISPPPSGLWIMLTAECSHHFSLAPSVGFVSFLYT